jgi:hypothetical protein
VDTPSLRGAPTRDAPTAFHFSLFTKPRRGNILVETNRTPHAKPRRGDISTYQYIMPTAFDFSFFTYLTGDFPKIGQNVKGNSVRGIQTSLAE